MRHHHAWRKPRPLDLMIRPVARIVRELPPRRKSYRVALFFHAVRLNSCYGWSPAEVKWATKKPLELTPVRNQIVLWTFDTPCGVGIRSNGLPAGFLTSNGTNSNTAF